MRANAYRFFIKYLSSYLILLLIPITVLTLAVNNLFVHRLQEEVISGNLNNLDKVRYVMDDQLKWIEDMTHQLLLDDNSLYQYRISDQWGYKAWGLTRELRRFQRLSPFIHEIWLYYKNEQAVFTSNGVYTLPVLAKQIYSFEDLDEQALDYHLNGLNQSVILPPRKDAISGKSYLRMFVPLFPNQKLTYGTLGYLINEEAIQQLLSTYDVTEGSTWVFEQKNRLITGIGTEAGPSGEVVTELVRNHNIQNYQKVDIEGEEYYLFVVTSKQSAWKYATLLPVRHVLHKVEQAQKWFTYGVAALVLLGGGIIYTSMLVNYRPIHRLRKESIQALSHRGHTANELDTVRDALHSLLVRNRELDQRVKNQAGAAKNQLLLSLLKGEFDDPAELEESALEIGLPVSCRQVVIAIVEFPPGSGAEKRPAIQELEKLFPEECPAYGMVHVEPNRTIFVVSVNDLEPEEIGLIIRHFQESVSSRNQIPVTVGVGGKALVSNAPQSYLEAQTAIGYRFIQGLNRVIFFWQIPITSSSVHPFPYGDMEGLLKAVRSGSTPKIEASLSQLLSYIKQNQPPLIVARGLCFEMIRLINGVWKELGLDDPNSDRYPDIFTIERLETIDEFENLIMGLSRDLCEAFGREPLPEEEKAGEANAARSVKLMIRYIHAHFDECEFSLQGMSEQFGMALPNLGQFFKDRTGQNLLEYTTHLRMEKAKNLLAATQLPLKAVAEEVGYYNVSSFIRRFKQLSGQTPGEYRTQSSDDR
jgi:two-component system, response regulator YesN